MSGYKITCCSTADMPYEYFRKKGISFACFHYRIGEQEYLDDLGQSVTFEEFYAKIAAGALPITSQVNVDEFIQLFEPILAAGEDVLHISLSSGISGAFSSALIARDELARRYPERKIKVVDSLGASSGYGMLVDAAWDMQAGGASIEQLNEWLEMNKLKLHHWFFSTDLTHYKRGGRISATSFAVGSLLNMCPLMNMDNRGMLIPRKKIRGKKHVIEEIVKMMEAHAQGGLTYSGKCFISNSACQDDARAVAGLVEERFKNLNGKVLINSVGTVIGSHTGPGTVALFFWGDERVN